MIDKEFEAIIEENSKIGLHNLNFARLEARRKKREQRIRMLWKLKDLFIVLLVFFILSFTFYWFEWRPSIIRADCGKRVLSNNAFRLCLAKNGMKPESLFVR